MRKFHTRVIQLSLAALFLAGSMNAVHAATTFDAGGGTHWWFNPLNWSVDRIPPNNAAGTASTDVQINLGTMFTGNMGEGVVYDPVNDPGFAAAQPPTTTYPVGFGPQSIAQLYISRAAPTPNLLTIKGDLAVTTSIVGRSSGAIGLTTEGRVNQLAGVFDSVGNVDLGQSDTSQLGNGNGIWDLRGGTFIANRQGGTTGLRLSGGSSSTNTHVDAMGAPTGPGGSGRFISRPTTPGHTRVGTVLMNQYRGNTGVGPDPDGISTGVSTLEFHYNNAGLRPIQSVGNLTLNNGFHSDTGATTSARLDLRLDAAVPFQSGTIPINLGLVDVDFDDPTYPNDDFVVGIVAGSGTLGSTFNTADGATNLPEGSTVSAVFGNTQYNWSISYHGIINWADINTGAVASVQPGVGGTDSDVVLIGLSSQTLAVDDADFDGDNDVDGNDFLIWQRGLGAGNSNATGDADNDLDVDANDLAIWKTQFGTGGSVVPAVASIPEPSAIVLALGLICGVLRAKTMQRASRWPDPSNLLGARAE
jgi:hypothetical protein